MNATVYIYLLAFRAQVSIDERVCHHIVDIVAKLMNFGVRNVSNSTYNLEGCLLSISEVVQLSLLIDNTDGCFLSPNPDALDIVACLPEFFQLRIYRVGSLYSSLCMKLSRIGNFEENILHDVRYIRNLELELLPLMRRINFKND